MSDLTDLPSDARKLLAVIKHQAEHGTLRSKAPGVATMPEVHEACGLDPEPMQEMLRVLVKAGLITMEGDYPYEELRLRQI
jgi:hypothetical protein